MNFNKGQIVGIIIIFIILASVGIAIYLLVLHQKAVEPEIEPEPTISFFVQVFDVAKSNYTKANYSIEYNQQVYKQGFLGDFDKIDNPMINEISNLPKNETLMIYTWSSDFYTSRILINRAMENRTIQIQKEPYMRKGKVNISIMGGIKENSVNKIIINVTVANGSIRTPTICLGYHGFTYLKSEEGFYVTCRSGWQNSTSKHPINDSFGYLPENYFYCQNTEEIVHCQKIDNYSCLPLAIEIPEDFSRKVDWCYSTGETFTSESFLFPIEIKATSINELTYLKVFLSDSELIRDFCNELYCYHKHNRWLGKDVGMTDIIHEVYPFEKLNIGE